MELGGEEASESGLIGDGEGETGEDAGCEDEIVGSEMLSGGRHGGRFLAGAQDECTLIVQRGRYAIFISGRREEDRGIEHSVRCDEDIRSIYLRFNCMAASDANCLHFDVFAEEHH